MVQDKNILMAMEVYYPDVDGVVQVMHHYLTEISKTSNKGYALAPKAKAKLHYVDKFPYKVFRCKSMRIPFEGTRYGLYRQDKKFREEANNVKYDIIHLHTMYGMSDFAYKIAKKQNIPIVATFHTRFSLIYKQVFKFDFIVKKMLRKLANQYNRMDVVYCCGEEVANELRSYGYTGKIDYLPYGVEWEKCDEREELRIKANQTYGLDENTICFVFVGRLVALKRVDFSLQMLKKLKESGFTNFKFFIGGKGMEEARLKAMVKEYDLTDNVVFLGFVTREQMPELYSRCDLFLFPSTFDTFGLVKLEAASFDTPSLFIENSCAGSGVIDGENGYLCKDNVDAYLEKVKEAISDREKLKQVGINAGKTLYCNWETATELLLEKYEGVIAEHKAKQQECDNKQ